ncbi:MAG: DUF2270 domain-containing protein [Sulfitobacter sp.]|uniref:DUF2270 domain-containing protein n=1 Tax=Alphaproteobacteria TaxID=28211 RepID=UPI002942705E|nr:DUF2270 domain-containing protein [Sulfitobacter sp. LC.270.F.C4]WOI16676.1 DUF2270 domain-containing protein [Sulfitobacter sp. LC.270.F.C4]
MNINTSEFIPHSTTPVLPVAKSSHADFTPAEMGALAHLYRGEVYRSTVWRTRLDTTTNWAVVVTGVSLTVTFGSLNATVLPLILVGLLVGVFLMQEARRYRYFNVWRARARLMETDFYAPLLRGPGGCRNGDWEQLLADDYERPQFHISFIRAIGRRLRKNYAWVFAIQVLAYCGKLSIHPTPLVSADQLFERASIGPVPGHLVLICGVMFYGTWSIIAVWTYAIERAARRDKRTLITIA